MKRFTILLLTAAAVAVPSSAAIPRPINDGVSNTLLLTEREGSYASQGGAGATVEFGEPAVGGAAAVDTVWYRYVAPVAGRYIVEIEDNQGLRAELRFPGNPATTLPLMTFVDGTSNTLFPNTERLSVDLARGQEVYLVVDAAQPFDFSWRFVEVNNDHYRDAESLIDASGTIIRGDRGATRSAYEVSQGFSAPAIWFEWTAPATGNFHFDLVGSRQWGGSFADFSIRVFDSLNGAPTGVPWSANGSSLDNSTRVTVPAAAGHVYYIACYGGLSSPDSQIWLSWYPPGSAGFVAWAQSEYRVSEADGSLNTRMFKLRGDGDCSIEILPFIEGSNPATGGVDYSVPGGAVPFPVGTRSNLKQIGILPNIEEEGDETVGLGFTNPTGGLGIQDGTSNTVLITEQPSIPDCGLTWREMRVREGQTAYVELRRHHYSLRQVAVNWRVRGNGILASLDMPALHGTAYLAPGQMVTSIPIPVYQDSVFEGSESFTVELTDTPQLGSITDGTSNTVVIVEDDDVFAPQVGGYCGLLDTGGWGALIKCTVTGIGRATGTVSYRGVTYPFAGSFDADGELVAHFARGTRPSLALRLRFGEGWARCAASLRDPEGDWADGYIRRLPYDGKKSIAPQAGRYTLHCQGIGSNAVAVPTVGVSVVLGDGSVRTVGRTADNIPFTTSGRIAQSDPEGLVSGECALLLPLYGKTGSLYGHCDFGLGPQHNGLESSLHWLKPWRPRDALYPAMPFQNIACHAIRYTAPASGFLQSSSGDGSVRFLNGGTPLDGTSNTLFISETNQVSFPGGNPLNSITFDSKTGWFSGKIYDPGTTVPTPIYGTWHQGGYNIGRGFFPGTNRSGEVVIDDV